MLALVLSPLNALLFPLGTVLAFYTLWLLPQDDVRVRFERETRHLTRSPSHDGGSAVPSFVHGPHFARRLAVSHAPAGKPCDLSTASA